jgi:hypothetical protein
MGKLVETPHLEYLHREHGERYSQRLKHSDSVTTTAWFEGRAPRSAPYAHWRRLAGYTRAVWRASIPLKQKVCCAGHLSKWSVAMRRELLLDLEEAWRHRGSA